MASRRSYVARHRHGRPGLFGVAALMATWPPRRPLRRRWFGRLTVSPAGGNSPVIAMPLARGLSHRAA
jgi:hypothetical protein